MSANREALRARWHNDCVWHVPGNADGQRMADNRRQIYELGLDLINRCPPGRELSLALTHLDMVLMLANAAVVRNPEQPCGQPHPLLENLPEL